MNIALFTESYYPEINGVATSVKMLKEELEREGNNVYVFTTKTPGAPEQEFHVYRVPSIPFAMLSERRVGLFYQRKLAKLMKRLNLDIIHTHTEFSLGIFGRIMSRRLGIPMVHTYHTLYEDYTHYVVKLHSLDRGAKYLVRKYTKHCCNLAEHVIVPTAKIQSLLYKYQVRKSVSVVPTGIDLNKFIKNQYPKEQILQIKKEFGITENQKVILYIGRVSQEKNIAELIDAVPALIERHQDFKFLIVGGGPELEILKEQAKKLAVEEYVIFAGARPWDLIGLYYAVGDVFVSASQSETQGLTYIEAMAASLPLVAKKDACLEEILIQDYNGYQFTDREGFLNAIDAVLYSDRYDALAKASEELVRPYSKQEYARNVMKVYEQIKIMEQENRHQEKQRFVKIMNYMHIKAGGGTHIKELPEKQERISLKEWKKKAELKK